MFVVPFVYLLNLVTNIEAWSEFLWLRKYRKSGAMSKDLIVYVCLLVLAAIQFVIAFRASPRPRC